MCHADTRRPCASHRATAKSVTGSGIHADLFEIARFSLDNIRRSSRKSASDADFLKNSRAKKSIR
jgi:hypothetical protein